MIPISQPSIGFRERFAVDRVLRSGSVAQGLEVKGFEQDFSKNLVEGRPVVAVNAGTSGLHLGLLACGVQPGDEVIVPSFSFAATANSVVLAGGVPVFGDIDPSTFCLDPRKVEELITEKTKAIMPVHLYGHPADMPAFERIASKYGLQLFEDAAQAHGAEIAGKKVGSFGSFGMFSLYATKNMTSAEGGMVSFAREDFARSARLLRNQGMQRAYENEVVGFNNRMTDVHAAIGRVQLQRLPGFNRKRRANAKFYDQEIEGLEKPVEQKHSLHVYHQYSLRVIDDRDGFCRSLENEYGVKSAVYYPTPLHKLPSFSALSRSELPKTIEAAQQVLSIPVHPNLSQRQLEKIVTAVNSLAKAGA